MSKLKKVMVIFLSLFLGFNTQLSSTSQPENKKPSSGKMGEVSPSNINKLLKDPDWIKLSKYWKTLNRLPEEASGSDRYKLFKPVIDEHNKVVGYFNGLKTKKILSPREIEYLQSTIEERYHYLSFKVGTTKCYDMSELGYKIVLKRDDLEKRYETLEKLFKENKINSETFKQAKEKIIEDFKFIDANENQKPEKEVNSNLIDLLINLNR